ncbi:MAG: hypothetical protein ACK40K_05995 [Raineya sp.]
MKKTTFILLLLTGFACKKNQEANSQVKESQSNQIQASTSLVKDEKESKPKEPQEILTEFRQNTWYEGRIKDFDIWFFAPKTGFAMYGYNSSKGASMELINKNDKDKKIFSFETLSAKTPETFEGNVGNDGVIRGKWKSGSKSFNFELKPVNFSNPRNAQEFLEAFADLKLPFQLTPSIRNDQIFKDYYQEKKLARGIDNLTKFIPYKLFNILGNKAVLWGKTKIGENYLAIFQTELIGKSYQEKDVIEHEGNLLNNEDMFFAVLLNAKGEVLDGRILGNSPTDPYYLDFSFEITKNKEIAIIWTQYMRDGAARMEAGSEKQVIKIKGNKFQ